MGSPFRPAPMYGGQSFARVAPVTGGAMTDVRYYQERAGQAQNMDKVIGTTSAPSSAHQLTGFTPDGYAIWEKVSAPAPAPSGGGGGGGGGASPQQQLQVAQLTKEAEEYRAQAEKTIGEAQAKIAELSNEELQRQKAAELQNRLSIQASANQARGMMAPSLKIASAAPQTAGTQTFKRRRDQATMAPIQSTAGINVPTGSVLNI